MLLLIIVLFLLFGVGVPYYGYNTWGTTGLGGGVGLILLIFVLLLVFRGRI